jgi:hypothetical protein
LPVCRPRPCPQVRPSWGEDAVVFKPGYFRDGAGRLNKQIADELGIAERTVKLQRAQLMAKLGVGSAAGLGALAERLRQISD